MVHPAEVEEFIVEREGGAEDVGDGAEASDGREEGKDVRGGGMVVAEAAEGEEEVGGVIGLEDGEGVGLGWGRSWRGSWGRRWE